MKIILCELEDLCSAMLTRLEEAGLSTIYFPVDYYWTPFLGDDYDHKEMSHRGLGQLCDDLEWIGNALARKRSVSFIEFQSLGGLINVIGYEWEKLPNKTPPNKWPIKISDLKQLFNFIFRGAESRLPGIDEQPLGFQELDVPFNSYWRVDLKDFYTLDNLEDLPLSKHPLPTNLPALTKHFKSSPQLSMNDFEQISILFTTFGSMPESNFYCLLNINNYKNKKRKNA